MSLVTKSNTFVQFVLFANAIQDNFEYQVANIFAANRALSRAISTNAMTHTLNGNLISVEFPYFIVPGFEAYAYQARTQAGLEMIQYAPIANDVQQWINFTETTRTWIDESKQIYDDLNPGANRAAEPSTALKPLPPYVYQYASNGNFTTLNEGFQLFVPSLQTSPPPLENASYYENVDLFSDPLYKAVSLASVKLKGKSTMMYLCEGCVKTVL